jgi:hypothetical protein
MVSHSQFHSQSPTPPAVRIPFSWRWLVVLGVSALLHLVALEWTNEYMALPSAGDEQASVTTTMQLYAPPPPPSALPPQPAVKPKPKFKPRPHPLSRPVPVPAPVSATEPAPTSALTQTMPLAPADEETPAAGNQTATEPASAEPVAAPANTDAKADTPVEKESAIHYKVDLPPSAELNYDVQKVALDGAIMRGHGTINWHSDGSNYQVTGEVGVLFFTMLTFKSEGVLDQYGIAPVLYSEKHFHRSETNTHFNRDERNSISFSASTVSYPRKGGEQDRGSVIWQLAGIGRGDHEKFVPGAKIDLFVAGVRDGDLWSILVVDQEEIDVGDGKTLAWHVVRLPRAGTYDQKIDIWLAPHYAWCPVKVRYTEKNGDYLDMSMSSFHPALLAGAHAESTR